MGSGQLSGIKRFFLWDYRRACWHDDVMLAIILAFIFVTPRSLFRDQPRASDIVRLPEEHGASVFWVEPDLLDSVPEPERGSKVQQLLRSRYARRETVVRVE